DFNAVKQWLSHCCAHHQKTCLSDTTRVAKISGFKLIECSSRKLVTLSEIAEVDKMQFIALSYVWGSKDASDIPAGDGLPTQTPKVIDDAIAATQYMGYNYLWVDRYCIPQDNPEAKHCQIRSMDIIYECATVTIIAATGDDPSYGLPGVASTRRVPQEFVDIGSGTLVLLYPDIDYQLSKTRWDTRAWTYQEGLLSCRRLFFLDNQVYFQCNSIRCMESIVTPSEADDSLYRRSPLYMYDLWNNHIPFPDGRVGDVPEELLVLIDTYTERELGFQSDALNAFEGILRRFVSAAKPVYHIWGIPIFTSGKQILDRLVAGFLWRLRVDDSVLDSLGQEQRRAPYPGTMRRRLFPSWSWVDWNG
ncbi:heterokaryon incompatibility protein-domain-containing protein, partial [Neurospora tetraspora]